jgi:toxin ParE1/3/4
MKARKVTFRPAAEGDLDAIFEHIANDSPKNALAFVLRIRSFCEALAEFSERGSLRRALGEGIRIVGFERRVAIAFRVDGDRVRILRVFYGGRNLEQHLMNLPIED